MTELQSGAGGQPPEVNFTNEIVPNSRNLHLCVEADPWLADAFAHEALIVVNGLMLVKFAGATVGVPLREETLPGGTTELDAWYAIDHGEAEMPEWHRQTAIRQAFFRGETHVNLPGVTSWLKLRQVNVDRVCPGEDFIQKVQAAASSLRPDTPMPNGQSRKAYLNSHLPIPEP